MYKSLIAGALALTLGMTSLAPTPAQANMSNEQAWGALLGLLIVGAAIHENRDSRPEPAPVVTERPNVTQRPNRNMLPEQCLRRIETRRGETVRMFGRRCMRNNYRGFNRLPDHCERTVRTDNGRRSGFVPRCLRQAGYRWNRR
jgi:hypothetical protein|tara:strand:- start:58 stop:489 length:432 start_codon:yes stop_codon:yes gene_type:complete